MSAATAIVFFIMLLMIEQPSFIVNDQSKRPDGSRGRARITTILATDVVGNATRARAFSVY